MKTLSITLLLLFFLFTSCENNVEPINQTIDYEISVNEIFSINLTSNPTTGFSWKWTNKQSNINVDKIAWKYTPDTTVNLGKGGKETWTFKGIQSGIDTIRLDYYKSWDSSSIIYSKEITVKVR